MLRCAVGKKDFTNSSTWNSYQAYSFIFAIFLVYYSVYSSVVVDSMPEYQIDRGSATHQFAASYSVATSQMLITHIPNTSPQIPWICHPHKHYESATLSQAKAADLAIKASTWRDRFKLNCTPISYRSEIAEELKSWRGFSCHCRCNDLISSIKQSCTIHMSHVSLAIRLIVTTKTTQM